jgi:hypothetical protein
MNPIAQDTKSRAKGKRQITEVQTFARHTDSMDLVA